ncbi:transcription factor HIVEP2 [Coregonus clupeaformis]|uniref:transcription factor HIVEP2 n=1 Tax=Coregonus clupeaformis TaxID=59861 RepID=UPI001E1C47F3|nr:transcription factor HIVEP2 [Coregonus clupeaformis]
MESLETTAEAKCSKEALEMTVPQRKSAAPEPTTAQTKITPSADSEGEGWHQGPEPEEDQSRTTCCPTDKSDSGKLRQLEGKPLRQLLDQPCSHPHYNVLTSYPPQERQTVPFARQKTADHLVSALPLPHVSCGGSSPQRSSPSLPASLQHCSQLGTEELSKDVCSKMEQKQQQRPGKYVCDYCGRACAKPSVLTKHIRSHTGERPYPCVPCGFSFKTKSNLYKHRKSHAHSVKAGTVPFSELGSYNANMEDQRSLEGEGELYSDAEQSSDTDEDDSSLLDSVSAEEPDSTTAVKVPNLIAQRQGVTLASTLSEDGSSRLSEINAAQPPAVSQVSRAIQSNAIKQRLALRLSEKRSSDTDTSLSLPSHGSKCSTDSGYFSCSESIEHQTGGPPNTNAKSYQEIMFGKCYKPNPKQKAITVVTCRTDLMNDRKISERGVSRVFTQEKESMVESIRINTHSFTREDIKEAQLEVSDSGQLVRSNSMPTSSVVCQDTSQGLRGSHSFDERASPGGIRRLTRQAAFEHSAHDGPPDHCGNISDISNLGVEMESFTIQQKQAMEFATRKRRKEKCVVEEEDVGGQYHTDYDHSEEMRDYDSKQASQGALTTISSVKGHAQSVHTQEMWEKREREERRSLGNVISVIQHTNSLTRSLSEQSDSYNYQRQDKPSSMDVEEQTETREMHKRTEIFAHQLSDSRLLDKSYQMTPKLVRQSNIPVPEIRVTVEPDSPEKDKAAEVKQVKVKEPDRHIEEFQWPQRSETLSQFPPEKLPPKKKRLRLADLEHSSGESSFESACTSLSRSPSQDSNLSYCSSFSFDREEREREVIPKPASPAARQDEFGKALEFLAVPGSGHSLSVLNQRQQHEMRRSSSEQAPCHSQCRELPEVRSVSFDYGSLSPTAKVRHAELSASYSEPRRGNLVRQESLNVDLEFAHPVLPLNILPQYLSNALSFSATALLSHSLPMFAPQPSHSGLLVPVRIQTHVPSYGSITYTTVSQIVDDPYKSVSSTRTSSLTSHFANVATNLDTPNLLLGHPRGLLTNPVQVQVLDLPPAKLKTGIPLSLTSRTISTTNCGSSGGSNKRMLSPASSSDLFMEVKQQKRVKEEKMYGEIVEELGAVELGNYNVTEENKQSLKSEFKSDTNQLASAGFPSKSSLSASSSLPSHNEPASGSFISPQQQWSESPDSPMDNSPTEASLHPHALLSLKDFSESGMDSKAQMDVLVQLVKGQGILISDRENTKLISPFPSLRTVTGVSWCYLNYTKPNSTHSSSPLSSVYASWYVSSHNPNPPNLNTSATLALLRSKQTTNRWVYTMAAMDQPGTGKLVSSSLLWRKRLGLLQSKPVLKELDVISYGRKLKDASCRVKAGKEDWKDREVSSKQTAVPTPTPTPTRIKIFEGGFKSNEDYVYVRGRGRGKYICEECGIRCKKPSMLKKHIRTHTDVRPYVCRVCNFAFKTKGNLTKHMKSKAHMKKCLELGVSVTVDDTETLESDDIQQDSKTGVLSTAKHQFSDADDSDGMDEEIDDIDEDDDDDDDYDGDSTPKILSRSTSPQLCGGASLSVTATAVIQGVSSDLHGCPLSTVIQGVSSDLHGCPLSTVIQGVSSDLHGCPLSTVIQGVSSDLHGCPLSTIIQGVSSDLHGCPLSTVIQGVSSDLHGCPLSTVIQGVSSDLHGCPLSPFHPLPSCLSTYTLSGIDVHSHPTSTLPSIDVHPHPHPPSMGRRTGPDRRTVLASSLDKEDCCLAMLSPDQGCLFFDPYPTCLLSPGWESPLREPPPSRLRYPSPRRDHSPRGRSSPRWDTSPLRPSSPNLTPIQHLSPACMERPPSPGGVDLAGRRQRVVLRAVSPRRGGSQHRDSGDKTRQQAKAELVQQGGAIEMDMDQRRSVPPGSSCFSCPHQNLFSHLPLHSQQQAGTLLPMVPIGGIQVLHSLPSCSSDRTHLSALSPQKTELHQDSTKGGSVRLAALGAEDSGAQQQGRGMERERNPKQEEVLQTCTKAIASLRITSEEHL